MAESKTSAAEFLPEHRTVDDMRSAVQQCKGCDLYRDATQAVFGEGANEASLMFVGEQPGDREDREGHPFVGPAGRVLDQALAAAEIPRQQVYITNAVKHFKFIERGKRRLHQKPTIRQVMACRPWLESEFETVQPKVIVCLGGTAAQAVLGRPVRVTQERGKFISAGRRDVLITMHPSAILRLREEIERDAAYQQLVEEMKRVRAKLQQTKSL
jgi:DNA polymerase